MNEFIGATLAMSLAAKKQQEMDAREELNKEKSKKPKSKNMPMIDYVPGDFDGFRRKNNDYNEDKHGHPLS